MPHIFDLYKPFRNKVRRYNLGLCFEDLWAYSQHLFGDLPMRHHLIGGKFVKIKDHVYPWNLSLLARELVLHGSLHGGKRINTWNSLADFVNALRDVENDIATAISETGNVMASLHSIAHQQFPWQRRRDKQSLMRYLKIFGTVDVERCLLEKTGLTIRDFYFMGLAISGHLLRNVIVNSDQRYTEFSITLEKSRTFFRKMSVDLESLRVQTADLQKYDGSWEYTWNPLEATPFVRLNKKQPNLLHCPIPELLLRRISHGIFYDLINAPNFNNAYGQAFERYVGEVLRSTFEGKNFRILDQQEYLDGRNRKHGTDWILSDDSATLFFECKTKRLVQAAKIATDEEVIRREIGVLADAVVQLYKNIADALDHKTVWEPDGKPIFPVVLTLEDWHLFSPFIFEMLNADVIERIKLARLPIDVLEKMPFTIVSVREFENTAEVIKEIGINRFFTVKTSPEHARWTIEGVAQDRFSEAWRARSVDLFHEDWIRLIPELAGDGAPAVNG